MAVTDKPIHVPVWGPDVPEWILSEYYANGDQPYLTRLAQTFTDLSRRKAAVQALSESHGVGRGGAAYGERVDGPGGAQTAKPIASAPMISPVA